MKFVELLLIGISQGGIYALIALGFVVLFRATEVVNFGHGSLVLLGAYIVARAHPLMGFALAVVVGVLVTAAGAVLIERLLIRPLQGSSLLTLAILTMAVDVMLMADLTRRLGPDILSPGHPWGGSSTSLGQISIPTNRLIALATAALLIAILFAAFRYTRWGIAMRATAEDRMTAELMGIRLNRVRMSAWAIAAALAVVAGVFLTGAPTPGVAPVIGYTAWRAFPAAVLGGLDSPVGALVGGLIIGIVETFASGYQANLQFLGRGLGDVLPFVVMFLVLLVRPNGLFGSRVTNRA